MEKFKSDHHELEVVQYTKPGNLLQFFLQWTFLASSHLVARSVGEKLFILGHRIANFPNYVTLTSSLTHHRIVNLGPAALRPRPS